jgi:hypothetical protein
MCTSQLRLNLSVLQLRLKLVYEHSAQDLFHKQSAPVTKHRKGVDMPCPSRSSGSLAQPRFRHCALISPRARPVPSNPPQLLVRAEALAHPLAKLRDHSVLAARRAFRCKHDPGTRHALVRRAPEPVHACDDRLRDEARGVLDECVLELLRRDLHTRYLREVSARWHRRHEGGRP